MVESLKAGLSKILDDVLINQYYGATKDPKRRDQITEGAYEASDALHLN